MRRWMEIEGWWGIKQWDNRISQHQGRSVSCSKLSPSKLVWGNFGPKLLCFAWLTNSSVKKSKEIKVWFIEEIWLSIATKFIRLIHCNGKYPPRFFSNLFYWNPLNVLVHWLLAAKNLSPPILNRWSIWRARKEFASNWQQLKRWSAHLLHFILFIVLTPLLCIFRYYTFRHIHFIDRLNLALFFVRSSLLFSRTKKLGQNGTAGTRWDKLGHILTFLSS